MARRLITRFLDVNDIPALLQLESRQWDATQAADASTLHKRLQAHPDLCIGAFCARTDEALASLFLRPINEHDIRNARSWADCAGHDRSNTPGAPHGLFGISLTSISPQAGSAVFAFLWPHALKNGWRNGYLGSPIPGLKRALEEDPDLDVEVYARSLRGNLPRDPQLRYYHQMGFPEIIAVVPDYFPHAQSLDYGVLLRGTVPLSQFCPLWRLLPIGVLERVLGWIARRLESMHASPTGRRSRVLSRAKESMS